METTRQIEILEMLKKIILSNNFLINGLCSGIRFLYEDGKISYDELNEILMLIIKNKPSVFNEFKEFINEYWNKTQLPMGMGYWWSSIRYVPETVIVRVDYINALINKLNSK